MAKKRIGTLTGGGDVAGLNTVIKSVVYRGAELGREVIGIRRGWEGLTAVETVRSSRYGSPGINPWDIFVTSKPLPFKP